MSLEYIVSPDVLIWEVRFLCATLLPLAETRLVPAATVLLRSLPVYVGLQEDLSPNMNDDSLRCSEFFIVLTHEVFLRDASGAKELEEPCELLHETFRNILFKSGAFVPRTTSNSNAMGLRASPAEAQDFERFTRVLRALCSVMDAFEGALNVVKSPAASDEALRERQRQVLLKSSISKGITMDQYRKELGQKLFQTRVRLRGAAPNPQNSQAPLLSRPFRTPPHKPHYVQTSAFYAVVLHDFVAEHPDELDAKAGDSISVVAQSNREWFVAKSIGRLGKPGLIPISFVEVRDLATGKPIPDVDALMDNGTLPRVEDWKKQVLSYKANSIALGVLEDLSQTPATANSSIANPSISMQPATSGSFHEQLPLRPPSPPTLPDGLLLSASVVSFHYEMDEYWFRLHALYQPFDTTSSSTLPPAKELVLFRAYNDFFDFHVALLETFPREGGREGKHPRVVPFMPGPSDHVDDSLSVARRTELDDYLRHLCRLNCTTARYILEHHLTREFFAIKPGDIEKETDPQYDRMAEVDWYDPSDDPEPLSINGPPSPVDDIVEKLQKIGIMSNGARHSDSEGSDYGNGSEAIAASFKPGGYSQRQRSHSYSSSQTKFSASGQSAPGAVGNGNGYSATSDNGPYRDSAYSSSSPSSLSRRVDSPMRSSALAGGSTQSGRAASGNAGAPAISASNPHTTFIKIKVFDRIQDDLIAIRVHPRVTLEQLLDKLQLRLGQIARLSYRESSVDGEDYVQLQQDDDLLRWIGSTDRYVLYAD